MPTPPAATPLLPQPLPQYDQANEAQTRTLIGNQLGQCLKNGQDITFQAMSAIFLSPDGNRWQLGVDNAGNTVWTAL